jgi:gluconokinase
MPRMATKSDCVLGVDVGTTGARAVAFDLSGKQLFVESRDYALNAPRPGWAEQDPTQVYEAAMVCLRRTAAWAAGAGWHVRALGWSAILHSIIPVDVQGHALDASIIWADGRSTAQAKAIREEVDARALYRRTGCPLHPMYPLAKIRWFREERPEIFQRAATFVGIKEYVLRRWSGLHVCDRSVASGTGLYGAAEQDWDQEALDLAGIAADRLPPLVETTAPLDVPVDRLRDAGLPEDCVVVAGGGDGVLQTIGTGCVRPGQMVAMVATSGAVRAVVDQPLTDPLGRTWCYYLADGRWVAGTAINNAGIVYAWLRDQFKAAGSAAEIEDLNRWAAEIAPGSQGLLFLPYLAGERSPNWNANARGVLFGLSLAHDYRHLARATLEGVAYRMRTAFDPLAEVVGEPGEIRVAGGFVKSPLWLQIVSDVLGRRLTLVEAAEASSLGAAQLALRGAGLVRDFDGLVAMVAPDETVSPDGERHRLYDRLYDRYQRLYDAVRPEWDEIAALQAELAG